MKRINILNWLECKEAREKMHNTSCIAGMVFPKYKSFRAHKKYCDIAKILELKADSVGEGVKNLIVETKKLMKELNEPMSIKECGIEKLSLGAFDNQCTSANPRLPLVSELKEIYENILRINKKE